MSVIVTVMKDLWLEAAHKDICTADSVVVEGHDASLVKELCLMIYIPPCVRKETRVGLRSQTFKTAPQKNSVRILQALPHLLKSVFQSPDPGSYGSCYFLVLPHWEPGFTPVSPESSHRQTIKIAGTILPL